MSARDEYTLVCRSSRTGILDVYESNAGANFSVSDAALRKALRQRYPGLTLVATTAHNGKKDNKNSPEELTVGPVDLLRFARAGHADATLNIKDEEIQRFRYSHASCLQNTTYVQLVDARTFAKYNYRWRGEDFLVYVVVVGHITVQYILKQPGLQETTSSNNSITDELIDTVGKWQFPPNQRSVHVYDDGWTTDTRALPKLENASWKDVVLNPERKKDLMQLLPNFFDSESIFRSLGLPWTRSVILHGVRNVILRMWPALMVHSLPEMVKQHPSGQ